MHMERKRKVIVGAPTVDVRLGSAFEKVSIDADSESADSGASEKDE